MSQYKKDGTFIDIVPRSVRGMETDMTIEYSVITNAGGRETDEDYALAFADTDKGVFILGDGLGGHGRGDEASMTGVTEAMRSMQEIPHDFSRAFWAAENAVLERQKEERAFSQMKTTLCILDIADGMARWGHVGDSRVYYFCGGKVAARTLDHSVPQMLASSGQIRESQIRFHEDRNRLLRTVGVPWNRDMFELSDEWEIKFVKRMFSNTATAFLVCCDGWWEKVDERQMLDTLRKSAGPDEWLERMEEIIIAQGIDEDTDNYTAIGVFVRP